MRYHYIRNYHPERTPMGALTAPVGAECGYAYSDVDQGPTKSEILRKLKGAYVNPAALEIAFGQRPAVELFDTQADPEELVNLAGSPLLASVEADLAAALDAELDAVGDPWAPTLGGDGSAFDGFPWYAE